MKQRILECFKSSNAKAGAPLSLECWLELKTLFEVEAMHSALAELAEAGLVDLRAGGVYLTEKGQALIERSMPYHSQNTGST